jgi:hypothetical protein
VQVIETKLTMCDEFCWQASRASLMDYKRLGDAGELAAEAVPRLTRRMDLCLLRAGEERWEECRRPPLEVVRALRRHGHIAAVDYLHCAPGRGAGRGAGSERNPRLAGERAQGAHVPPLPATATSSPRPTYPISARRGLTCGEESTKDPETRWRNNVDDWSMFSLKHGRKFCIGKN